MDMIKIGSFLAELRRESGLTQEQLGAELGITNKTVSRWETGTYLPPVEMLQALSVKYNVSINEILSGERINTAEQYKQQAEANILTALDKSAFTLKDKQAYFAKKWLKDHVAELVIEIIILCALAIVGAIFFAPLTVIATVLSLAWAFFINNRKMSYVEHKLYDDDLKRLQRQDGDEK